MELFHGIFDLKIQDGKNERKVLILQLYKKHNFILIAKNGIRN